MTTTIPLYIFTTTHGVTMHQLRVIVYLIGLFVLVCGTTLDGWAQSQTTGTLNLRNTQPSTISLSLPQTGVTGYTMLLPAQQGSAGQVLTVSTVTTGQSTLTWADAAYWGLAGSAIIKGGTAAGEQYLGTSNEQDVIIASNGVERLRINGAAGARQGFIGLGTSTPNAPIDLGATVLLSNSGTSTELRFAEPFASGTNYTAFRSREQTQDITYTLPGVAPDTDGMVLTGSPTGDLQWRKPLSDVRRGIFIPAVGAFVHVIPVGTDITSGSIPLITMMNPAGTTIGLSITAIDDVNDTFTVETSVPLGAADRIAWMLVRPN